MNLRPIALAVSTIAAMSAAHARADDKAADSRPNILWLITEDMGAELGCYGAAEVRTPVLDDLAARGVRFANAFTVTPVCSTSRSSFCTGMYAISIGAHQHRTPDDLKRSLPNGVKTISQWMRDAGYYTANMAGGGALDRPGKVDWNFKFDGPPFDGHEWSELKDHQPFYAQINHSQSHRAFTSPKHADPAKVELPPYYADHATIREDWAKYLDEITEVDGLIGDVLARLEADGMADNTIIFFFGDHGQAHMRGKQWPYDSGLHIPCILYIPPALARPEGYRPGTVDTGLVESLDITATTIALAGAPKPPAMQGRVLYGEQREPRREYAFASRDRCDMTMFRIRSVRDDHYRYIRNYTPETPFLNINLYKENSYPAIGVMRKLHEEGKLNAIQDRFFAMTQPAEELYYIDEDRWEINNLAQSDDPKHQAALARLRGQLDEWIERCNDPAASPEPMSVRLAEMESSMRQRDMATLVLSIIEQQRGTPGMSAEYAAYLDQVEQIAERAMAAPESADKGKSKDKAKRNAKSKAKRRAAKQKT